MVRKRVENMLLIVDTFRKTHACTTTIIILSLTFAGSEYRSDSPFGLNYYLPIVPVSCVMSDTNISQCNISTQLIGCNHRNGIGIFCQGKNIYTQSKI